MTTLSIQPPYPIITGADGQPLEDGYIWIGTANLNPITNPIAVYWDAALTQPAAQPIRTSGGYPVNAGTPARLYVGGDYSILVQDRRGSTVYSAPAATERYSDPVVTGISSAEVSFLQAGSGAVTRTAESKMREIASRADFVSDAAFNAGKGNKPNIDGSGNFDAKVTPAGEDSQINLSGAVHTVAAGPRDAVVYANATSVSVFRNFATMGGFRFRGQYSKGRAPTFAMPASKVVSFSSDLAAESVVTYENWYGIFAAASDGDSSAQLVLMPFLRAYTVAGSGVNLSEFKEGMSALAPQTYSWTATNNLANTDILVITENAGFSGRVTSITANTAGSITLSSIGSIAAGDTFLPAPPGFDHYVYLGCFYVDTSEVRNIYDTGSLVKTKGIFTVYPNTSAGSYPYPTFVGIDATGYISPLATGVVIDSSCVLSTASAGDFAEYFGGDGSNHVVQSAHIQKDNSGNLDVVFSNIQVPFLYPQQFWYANAGTLSGSRINGQFNVTGWFEP